MRSTMTRDDLPMRVPDPGGFRVHGKPAHASTTLEARWIRRGPVPETMVEWLGPFDDWIERREDRYFVDPSVPDLGIKIKDGVQLDLKALRGGSGRLMVPGGGRGRLGLWEKWSFPLHASALPPADAAGWLALQKTRRRRSFRVEGDEAEERPVDQAELPGCSIELTDVAIGEGLWWTLGLEATGSRETLERNLRVTVGEVFREPSPGPNLLDLRHSMSYPRWLAGDGHVARQAGHPEEMEDLT
jgi:hypothetical protein